MLTLMLLLFYVQDMFRGCSLWVFFAVLGFSSWYLGFVCAFMSLTVGCVSACAPDVSSLLVW